MERAAARPVASCCRGSALTIGHAAPAVEPALRRRRSCERIVRQTLQQLAAHGARSVVVHTGHGPLDLDPPRSSASARRSRRTAGGPGLPRLRRVLPRAQRGPGTGLGTTWPVAIDHGSIMETSWVLAMEPDLVALDRLPGEDRTMRRGRSWGSTARTRGRWPAPPSARRSWGDARRCSPSGPRACSTASTSTRSPTCAPSSPLLAGAHAAASYPRRGRHSPFSRFATRARSRATSPACA